LKDGAKSLVWFKRATQVTDLYAGMINSEYGFGGMTLDVGSLAKAQCLKLKSHLGSEFRFIKHYSALGNLYFEQASDEQAEMAD
jgi:hypothetical protein